MALRSITFTVPHQRTTTGGVYVIEQLAAHLASELHVTLVVRRGPLRQIDGVEVIHAPRLDASVIPASDVLVGGLAQGDFGAYRSLTHRAGIQVFLFQGYTTPGNPRVRAALDQRPRILAVSQWLVDDARRLGCPARLVRVGLDRALFRPGPPAAERGPVVSMLCHPFDWKGGEDGQRALSVVRREIPTADIRVFGPGTPPDDGTTHLGTLAREDVARLMRDTAVMVVPSWEEGLGLPGVEALASGASLATTDTKGSRDYAFHERTALVSPPRAPGELAANVVRLLREPELRGRLARQGAEKVLERYPPWADAAVGFRQALEEIIAA